MDEKSTQPGPDQPEGGAPEAADQPWAGGIWIAVGVAFGIAIGVAMDNILLGLPIGIGLGLALEAGRRAQGSGGGPQAPESD